jgi:DNA-binding response OmpR family regulator
LLDTLHCREFIDNFMVRLRHYIEDDPEELRHLPTLQGAGVSVPGESGKK